MSNFPLVIGMCTDSLHLRTSYSNLFRQESCTHALEKYGVGSCGPRGFYGTIGKIGH